MTSNSSQNYDVTIGLASHAWEDSFDHVHGAKEVALKLVTDQRAGASSGSQLLNCTNNCFTGAAE